MEFNKKLLVVLLAIMLLTSTALLASMEIASAHTPPWEIETFAYISAGPDPIGLGQPLGITIWLDKFPPTAVGKDGDRWDGNIIEITKPDGSKQTLGPFVSDPVGVVWTAYNPDQVGTYTFVYKFPGDVITGEPVPAGGYFAGSEVYIGDTYKASESLAVTVTVQKDPIPVFKETPVPTGYWTRPINVLNRGWSRISGNWLGGTAIPDFYNRYSEGPESSHIMWTREFWSGGVMGGQFGDYPYYDGLSYEGFWGGLGGGGGIIINGRLYYNVQTPPRYGWYCVDLRTGEEYWFHNSTGPMQRDFIFSGSGSFPQLAFGQIYNYESPNQHGGFPYLWSTWSNVTGMMNIPGIGMIPISDNVWDMYDAFTGNYICSINHVPASTGEAFGPSTAATGKDGSQLIYVVNAQAGSMAVWNSSRAIWYKPFWTSNEYWMWRPNMGDTFDGRNGYSVNVSIPVLPGGPVWTIGEEIMVGQSGLPSFLSTGTADKFTMWAISLKPGEEGKLLWQKTYDTDYQGHQNLTYATGSISVVDGCFNLHVAETMQDYVYSLADGSLMWGPTEPSDTQLDFYSSGFGGSTLADGKLITLGMGGVIRAYNLADGNLDWTYTAKSIGFESSYGSNYPLSLGCIADGKLYVYSSEHSPTKPQWRGSMIRCVNIADGKEVWTGENWANGLVIADGYIVTLNSYDNRIYCYGKGPSETTITASPKVSTKEAGVLIEGTVTDQSAGAKGTPAIADSSMSDWMEYLYMQLPKPANAQGVTVKLTAFDSSGATTDIGVVQSDSSGQFKKLWYPPGTGEYTVLATFDGTASYGSSYAETFVGINAAPTQSAQSDESTSAGVPAEMFYAISGILIMLILVVAVIALRKR